ncbi:MAG: DUF3108 domain-containing protein [Betaproteobacteria bacterium]
MPFALIAALAGSLAIHAAFLFLPDVELSPAPEPPPLLAELQPPHLTPPPAPPAPPPKPHPVKPKRLASNVHKSTQTIPSVPAEMAETTPPIKEASSGEVPLAAPAPPKPPAVPRLPARGSIRYAVYRGTEGLEVGRASHDWFFADDAYSITTILETSGLAAWFKPVRIEMESTGKLVASGLQPQRLVTRRNGAETKENADFDWTTHQVTLARDGRHFDLRDGAQDIVSFQYQLAFLPQLTNGASLEIATGKKFAPYRIEALGEETLETPAGIFRTLHVRAKTDDTTELWLALDRQMLPVKIRYTDRKGESFEQIAVELGMPQI